MRKVKPIHEEHMPFALPADLAGAKLRYGVARGGGVLLRSNVDLKERV